jgi:quinol monooxygenase YgiN
MKVYLYQIKIDLAPEKKDEFIKNLRPIWFEFLKADDCSNYHVYQEFEKENTLCLIGEFDTYMAMLKHLKTQNIEVLVGASSVLGENFKINLSKVVTSGGLTEAKSLRSCKRKTV